MKKIPLKNIPNGKNDGFFSNINATGCEKFIP